MRTTITLLFSIFLLGKLTLAQNTMTRAELEDKYLSIICTPAICDSINSLTLKNVLTMDKNMAYYKDIIKEFYSSIFLYDSLKINYEKGLKMYNESDLIALIGFIIPNKERI